MKISIITVNLNNLQGLQKTVNSVLSQTWQGFEYFVMDGGSTDGSREFIESVSDRLTGWVSEKDRSHFHAMNKGIERSTGEYLLFLNSGDYLADDGILERVVGDLSAEDIIYGDLLLLLKSGKLEPWSYPDQLDSMFVYRESLPHPSAFIRREIFEKTQGYSEKDRITPDWQFFMRALFEFNATYKHLNYRITVYNLEGISSNPDNIEKMNREKHKFMKDNPAVLNEEYFQSVDEAFQILRFLKRSRTIRFITSLGLLGYLKKYLQKIR